MATKKKTKTPDQGPVVDGVQTPSRTERVETPSQKRRRIASEQYQAYVKREQQNRAARVARKNRIMEVTGEAESNEGMAPIDRAIAEKPRTSVQRPRKQDE